MRMGDLERCTTFGIVRLVPQSERLAMIKDLVVNLTLEAARDPAAEFALSIAAAFEAHIAATAFAFDPVVTPAVLDGLSSTWVDVQREESRTAAKAAIGR